MKKLNKTHLRVLCAHVRLALTQNLLLHLRKLYKTTIPVPISLRRLKQLDMADRTVRLSLPSLRAIIASVHPARAQASNSRNSSALKRVRSRFPRGISTTPRTLSPRDHSAIPCHTPAITTCPCRRGPQHQCHPTPSLPPLFLNLPHTTLHYI